jgi:L,D-peptidoglycan transpeptidase YkuD (ErfK/YbiS/YcfS/YnhG family)
VGHRHVVVFWQVVAFWRVGFWAPLLVIGALLWTLCSEPVAFAGPHRSLFAPAIAAPPLKRDRPATGCVDNLAARIRTVDGAGQLITVDAANYQTSVAEIALWQRKGPCWVLADGPWAGLIGQNGFSDHHREGDGTTPTGIYRLGPVVYGNEPNPGFHGRYHRLVCGDWWDEDPTSPAYNTFEHTPCGESPPFGGDSEALWTETNYYPSFAVVEYNADPVVPYAGSAIFVHADTGSATTGCVSTPLPDLDKFLRWMDMARLPTIVMGPSSELARF